MSTTDNSTTDHLQGYRHDPTTLRITDLGKFEGEPRYLPHFWSVSLEGGAEQRGNVFTVEVIDDDKRLFPELRRRKVVRMIEDEHGFVRDISTGTWGRGKSAAANPVPVPRPEFKVGQKWRNRSGVMRTIGSIDAKWPQVGEPPIYPIEDTEGRCYAPNGQYWWDIKCALDLIELVEDAP